MPLDDISKPKDQAMQVLLRAFVSLALIVAVGCGTTKTRLATEQLLVSDAVDQAVGDLDFSAMAGQTVFFDARYINNVKGIGFVNSEYIISSIRQQMVAADCRLQEAEEDADFVVEARVGTLGTNGHEIVYGVPANNSLSSAANLVPNTPTIPTIPELALAKKDSQLGAAKIAVFAYERESGRPVWQSGISRAKSTAQDFWFFGAGPFQRGSIYDGTQFAGSRLRASEDDDDDPHTEAPPVAYTEQFHFPRSNAQRTNPEIAVVGYDEELAPVVVGPTRSQGEPKPPPRPREQQGFPTQPPSLPTNQ